MNGTLWILGALFGFAVLGQLLSYIYRLRLSLHLLQKEIAESTRTTFETRRKTEWLECRLQDMLDAAQLRSSDAKRAWQRLDRVTRIIKHEARYNGCRVGLSDIDQAD